MIPNHSRRIKKISMGHTNGINPLVLKWARVTAGLSIDQVVRKLSRKGITVETVTAWESGETSPNYIQLERLAYEVYKRPLAIFFFPEPPEEETPRQAFRTLPDPEIDTLSQHIRFLLRQAKSMQANLEELYGGVNPAERQLLRDLPFSLSTPVAEIAKSVRLFLKIDLDTQLQWNNSDVAFKAWRSALEECGIFVFKDAFKSETVSGFCLYDMRFPVIYVNNSRPATHQVFTLFHEVFHLLSRTGGIDTPIDRYIHLLRGRNKEIEVLSSRFAGIFLVPDVDFDKRIAKLSITEDNIRKLADNYSVSREVILRRLLDKRLITNEYYGKLVAGWEKARPKKEGQGGDYYRTRRAYLGERYLEIVFSRFYQKKISIDQVADYLGVKVNFVPRMEALLLPRKMVA